MDFAGSRYQEGVLVLAYLYSTEFEGNPHSGNQSLLEWTESALQFWQSLQHEDGSFDEAYPMERSLAATAFTSFYIGETLTLLGSALSSEARQATVRALHSAGKWLCDNDETHGFLTNHLAAAAAALYQIHQLTGEKQFEGRSRYFLERILSHQSDEGWYEEYGGPDPGYQTHGSLYLAWLEGHTSDPELVRSLTRSMRFLVHFVHPDGSLGGEYASRNTKTYYPAAFEMWASKDRNAAWIAEKMRPSLSSGATAGLRCIDPQNYFPVLNNYVFASRVCALRESRPQTSEDPRGSQSLYYFEQAGIARVRKGSYEVIVGLSKGGILKVFALGQERLVYSDCGYLGRLRGGDLVSSQHLDLARDLEVTCDRLIIRGEFAALSRPVMRPGRFMAFRLFTLTIGRIPVFARRIKNILVRFLIYRKRALDLRFERTILLDEDRVTVRDRLVGSDLKLLEDLQWAPFFATIHMGSSRYFVKNEAEVSVGKVEREIEIDALAVEYTFERVIELEG